MVSIGISFYHGIIDLEIEIKYEYTTHEMLVRDYSLGILAITANIGSKQL